MWEVLSQAVIFISGALSIIFIAKKNKWGFVLGLVAQPFWFYTSYINEQWGVFMVSFVYTASWCLGIYEWFFKSSKIEVKKIEKENA